MKAKAPFGWTVIRRDSARSGFFVYKRDTAAVGLAADLAPFTFPTRAEAMTSGKRGRFAYKNSEVTNQTKPLTT